MTCNASGQEITMTTIRGQIGKVISIISILLFPFLTSGQTNDNLITRDRLIGTWLLKNDTLTTLEFLNDSTLKLDYDLKTSLGSDYNAERDGNTQLVGKWKISEDGKKLRYYDCVRTIFDKTIKTLSDRDVTVLKLTDNMLTLKFPKGGDDKFSHIEKYTKRTNTINK